MKHSQKAQKLLARMRAIERMERGTLCRMAGKAYYNLQAWRQGRNEVRYIREEEREAVQEAIDGYNLFTKLAGQYADEIIKKTRREHQKRFPKQSKTQKLKKKSP
jgi:hypothetical protein